MTPLPETEETLTLARRCVWYKPPAEALQAPAHLAAHVMAHGTAEDIAILMRHLGKAGMIEVLRNPPPSIIDPGSWWYCHLVLLDQSPPPPLPKRVLPT